MEMSEFSEVYHVSNRPEAEDKYERRERSSDGYSLPRYRGHRNRSSEDICRDAMGGDHLIIDKTNNLIWTKRDQVRLQNVDELFTRMMEHHNNVHTRTMAVNVNDDLIKSSRKFNKGLLERMSLVGKPVAENEIVMVALSFKAANFYDKKLGSPVCMTAEEAQLYLAEMDFEDPTWTVDERDAATTWREMIKGESNAEVQAQLELKMDKNNFHFELPDEKNRPNRRRSAAFNKRSQRLHASTKIADMPLKDCLWIHMSDLSILEAVAGRFALHDLVVTGFRDIRNSANFLPLPSAVFFCFCTFYLDPVTNEVSMHKVYLYLSISTNLLITYERQIMRKAKSWSVQRGDIGGDGVRETGVPSLFDVADDTTTTRTTTSTTTKATDIGIDADYYPRSSVSEPGRGSVICSAVMERFMPLYQDCLRLGILHLITTFALESLACQDTIMEFFSRALLYTKRISDTRVKLYYREKSFVAKQLVVLTKAFNVCSTTLGEVKYTLSTLQTFLRTGNFHVKELYISEDDEREDDIDTYREVLRSRLKVSAAGIGTTAHGGFQANVQIKDIRSNATTGGLVGGSTQGLFSINICDSGDPNALLYSQWRDCRAFNDAQLDTMHIFMDEYNFSTSLLKEQRHQLKEIKEAIDEREQLRGINMENLVALIGASTLPMSFISSAMGMNFELERIYDKSGGVIVMLWMCLAFTVACMLYFHHYSYIDFSINTWRKLFRTLICYRLWGPYLFPAPKDGREVRRVVRRADGRLVGTLVGDGQNDGEGDTEVVGTTTSRRITDAQLLALRTHHSSNTLASSSRSTTTTTTTTSPVLSRTMTPTSSFNSSSGGLDAPPGLLGGALDNGNNPSLTPMSSGHRKSLLAPLTSHADIADRIPDGNSNNTMGGVNNNTGGSENRALYRSRSRSMSRSRSRSRSHTRSVSRAGSIAAADSRLSEADEEDIRRASEAVSMRRMQLNKGHRHRDGKASYLPSRPVMALLPHSEK